MTPREHKTCIAALALLAFVCHAATGASSDDNRGTSYVISVEAIGEDTASIPDFDGDGMVGFGDFVKFAANYGLGQDDDGYDARYDLDGDGAVAFSDLLIFAENFGKEASPPTVTIPDANLRAFIEASLGKSSGAPITEAEMATLDSLDGDNAGISAVAGLETAVNLTYLSLNGNDIEDISALSGLIGLRVLILRANRISDILPLVANTGLGNGDTVDLRGNQLSSMSCNTLIPTLRSRDVGIEYDSCPENVVRILYVSPRDRPFRPVYSEGISKAILDVQSWFRNQLEGLTFQLYSTSPEWCRMPLDSHYYSRGHAWKKVMDGVQHCYPVAWNSDSVWVLYVDVDESCEETHELGAGGSGIVMVPAWDLRGLANPGAYYTCDKGPYKGPIGRWYGGLAHEIAHAVGVPHPPGCDAGLATCDSKALMWLGYPNYPDTYLRFDEKEILMRSPFFTGDTMPTDRHGTTEGLSVVHGVVLSPTGAPAKGIRISLVADTFWNWGEAGQDGTFRIGVPNEASGPFVVSVHGGQAASCHWLGYHHHGGLTSQRQDATQFAIGGMIGIEVRLPSMPDVLCGRTGR
ncbi:MAG: hypothetical protein OXR72_09325 [Gemmatimonadota bacterium]|nr:hypothetical protein [Gemmatimonadota bacterium]